MKETDNNFEFLVEYITAKVVEHLVDGQDKDLEEALLAFHNSETFEKLCQKETGLYIESPAYVLEMYDHELRHGSLRGQCQ